MPARPLPFVILGALLVLCVVVVIAANQIAGLDQSIAHGFGKPLRVMQTLEEVVKTASGRTITVRTTRNLDETAQAFVDRHNEAANAAKEL